MSVFIYLLTIINVVLIRCNDMKPETHLCNRSGANLSSTYNPKTPQWRVCLLLYLSKRCMLSLINCSPIQTPNFFWSNHYIWNLLSLLQAVRDSREIGHFRVPENPHFQKVAKCTTFPVKMSFTCMKNRFHIKGWALNLVLIQRPVGTRK